MPVVFIIYWVLNKKSLKLQNILLLLASYFFYACWDYRFLFLLIFSTFLDFFTGLRMLSAKTIDKKKAWFWLSICINLGILGFFKYYNFFIDSFADGFSFLGIKANYWTLQVILPVGISFYTFHGLSYVIDIYKNRIEPEKNFIDYAVFVSFFPLLVAGPIERATHLLPQIKRVRIFDYSKAVDGLRQILWGLFKKVVIADNAAKFADNIFNNGSAYGGSTILLGAIFFAVQIYCDFSGYSDIAIGTARLFGIELLRNFAFPYFSRDISEFWRRWHISLSSWFRDYLYIPLGGSKASTAIRIRNTFIIFLVSGFWHGANWTFVFWGGLHALFILPSILLKTNRVNLDIVAKGKLFPTFRESIYVGVTFFLTVITWVFFRSESVAKAFIYISKIFSGSLFLMPDGSVFLNDAISIYSMIGLIFFLFFTEWIGREQQFAISEFSFNWPMPLRWGFYFLIIIVIFYFAGNEKQFIYFQF
jgi:D-alanyl-lipoteichoic acid acyltransferase DltB (MBOAT superfamily)